MTMSKMFTPILISPRRSLKPLRIDGSRAVERSGGGAAMPPHPPLPTSVTQVVLGVDPGLATTGWGVIAKTDAHLTLRSYGVILSPAATALPERLMRIRRELTHIIESHKPSLMAIEELYFAKFAVSIAATAQARGVILLTA